MTLLEDKLQGSIVLVCSRTASNPLSLNKTSFLNRVKLKAFADDKKHVKKQKFFVELVENIVGKGENADYQHFLLFSQCFQKVFFFFFQGR